MADISIKEFYKDVFSKDCCLLDNILSEESGQDIGNFNVFDIATMFQSCKSQPMPYNRRTYYKISLIKGRNKVEFADKEIEISDCAVLFASPKIPYRYIPLDQQQTGHFCVFTKEFMSLPKTALLVDNLPIFNPNGDFVYEITTEQFLEIEHIFLKMHKEIKADYTFKYDLLRNYVIELIHTGQKLKPMFAQAQNHNAAERISTLFVELLERQFPIESPNQVLQLKTAKEFAATLHVHVNHLNKVLKDMTGKTTTEIISSRITQEAKILLHQTNWNISEIAFSLGFDEIAHFSNFFKKQTFQSPMAFRA